VPYLFNARTVRFNECNPQQTRVSTARRGTGVTPVGIRESYLGAQALSPTRVRGHVQLSKMLLATLACGVAATAGLAVALATFGPGGPPPALGGPPPPPHLEVLIIASSMFVLAWLATAVAFVRDQILRRLGEAADLSAQLDTVQAAVQAVVLDLRRELVEEQQTVLVSLEHKLTAIATEYGDQREHEGYARGMKVGAELGGPAGGELRTLRPVRPAPPR